MDSYLHVSNAVYATSLEEGREKWLGHTLGDTGSSWDYVRVRVAIDFRRELRLEDDGRRLVPPGANRQLQLTLREQIRTRRGELAAEAEAVLVARDANSGRSRPLNELERETVEQSK